MYRQNERHIGKIERRSLQKPRERADSNFELEFHAQIDRTIDEQRLSGDKTCLLNRFRGSEGFWHQIRCNKARRQRSYLSKPPATAQVLNLRFETFTSRFR